MSPVYLVLLGLDQAKEGEEVVDGKVFEGKVQEKM